MGHGLVDRCVGYGLVRRNGMALIENVFIFPRSRALCHK